MDNYRQTINSLSHKQLLWLLEQYHKLEWDVNKVLLETSKDRLKCDNAINLISKFFSYCQSVNLPIYMQPEHLSAWIDYRMGEMTNLEYRKRLKLPPFDKVEGESKNV